MYIWVHKSYQMEKFVNYKVLDLNKLYEVHIKFVFITSYEEVINLYVRSLFLFIIIILKQFNSICCRYLRRP